jgi:hypothetical protein
MRRWIPRLRRPCYALPGMDRRARLIKQLQEAERERDAREDAPR